MRACQRKPAFQPHRGLSCTRRACAWLRIAPSRPTASISPASKSSMADGWKTYWRMPGDSGVPPTFDWAGSANVASDKGSLSCADAHAGSGRRGDRLQAVGAAAHRGHAAGPSSPSSSSSPWSSASAARSASRRRRTSISRSLPLPPGAPAPQIAAALERVPRPQQSRRKGDPDLKRVTVSGNGHSPKLTIEASFAGDATGADVFIEAPEGLYVPMPKRVATDAARCRPVRDRPGPRSCPGSQGQDVDAHARQRSRRHRGAMDFSLSATAAWLA